jgi:hypothetical protein
MQAFDILLTSLDSRGIRESHLRLMLQKIEKSFRENVRKNTQYTKIGSKGEDSMKTEADEWKECYNSSILCAIKFGVKRCKPQVDICEICLDPYFMEDSHCNSCHQTFPSNDQWRSPSWAEVGHGPPQKLKNQRL